MPYGQRDRATMGWLIRSWKGVLLIFAPEAIVAG